MKTLITYFQYVDQYDADVDSYHLSPDLPAIFKRDGTSPRRLDEWWAEVLQSERFPILGRLIKAVLSIFTGRMIEQSFSGKNDIVTKMTNWLAIDTFSAIQSVKFDLHASFTRYR